VDVSAEFYRIALRYMGRLDTKDFRIWRKRAVYRRNTRWLPAVCTRLDLLWPLMVACTACWHEVIKKSPLRWTRWS